MAFHGRFNQGENSRKTSNTQFFAYNSLCESSRSLAGPKLPLKLGIFATPLNGFDSASWGGGVRVCHEI